MVWTINEWYGVHIDEMSPAEKQNAARQALELDPNSPKPLCPFTQDSNPGSKCNKAGGVCSLRESNLPDLQPATVCPSRFLETVDGVNAFTFIAKAFFQAEGEIAVIREVPFLNKIDVHGNPRTEKAGRIDWILLPFPNHPDSAAEWLAIETQAVYFSGARMEEDFKHYYQSPDDTYVPTKHRRPDWRSSGAKRLAPQLDVKAPAIRRWGKKLAVIVDQSFFNELAAFTNTDTDFENSEIIWVIMKYNDQMQLEVDQIIFAELAESVAALQATRPVKQSAFQDGLLKALNDKQQKKVHRLTVSK